MLSPALFHTMGNLLSPLAKIVPHDSGISTVGRNSKLSLLSQGTPLPHLADLALSPQDKLIATLGVITASDDGAVKIYPSTLRGFLGLAETLLRGQPEFHSVQRRF